MFEPEHIHRAWRSLISNYDQALSLAHARERFKASTWREALAERREEFPAFFKKHDYTWCDNQACFDFPVETAYQVRAIDAAIGLWLANPEKQASNFELGRIVARTTYLATFYEVTPHVQPVENYDFLICPLGWVEFLHTYFAGFANYWSLMDRDEESRASSCKANWLGIAANLIASTVCEIDYFLPSMIEGLVENTPEFSGAYRHFSAVTESPISTDLAYAAHDFALCHEIAHIAARDFEAPDEYRADKWAVDAYFGSWGRRPALHVDLAQLDPLKASIGPFAFTCALRAILAGRAVITKAIAGSPEKARRRANTYRESASRSRTMLELLAAKTGQFIRDPSDEEFRRQQRDVTAFCSGLLGYEVALFTFFEGLLSTDLCSRAQCAAREAGKRAAASW